MRILVLNYEFPPVGGGGGRAAEEICRVMANRGHEIRVQTAHVKGLSKREDKDGYIIFRAFSLRRRLDRCTVFEMAAYLVFNFLPSLKHALLWRPDVIHVHFAVPTGVLAFCISIISRIPYVLTAHLGDVPGAIPAQTDRMFKIVKPFSIPIWKNAGVAVAVSDHVADLAARAYKMPVEVIPNGLESQRIKAEPTAPETPVKLLYVGRFNEQKNLVFLLDVLESVRDIPWQMDMLGDGDLMELLRSKVSVMGLNGRVKFYGWVEKRVVENAMLQSDIFVIPSKIEGLPLVGVMALGYGLAILGSKVGGITNIVEDGVNGFLCSPYDYGSFANALRKMLISEELLIEMKRNSCLLAEKFDIECVATQYEKAYKSACFKGCKWNK